MSLLQQARDQVDQVLALDLDSHRECVRRETEEFVEKVSPERIRPQSGSLASVQAIETSCEGGECDAKDGKHLETYAKGEEKGDPTPEALAGSGTGKVLFKNERLRIHDIRVADDAEPIRSTFSAPGETIVWQVMPDESGLTPQPFAYRPGSVATLRSGRWFVFEVLLEKPKYTEEEVQRYLDAPEWETGVGSELFLQTPFVRMWDFTSSKPGFAKNVYHQHVLDHAFVVIGDSSLNLWKPGKDNDTEANTPAETTTDIYVETFGKDKLTDGAVFFSTIDHGGFKSPGSTEVQVPAAVHAIDLAEGTELFREYLIELK